MSEGEVRAILEKAGWSSGEVESALILLRTGHNPDDGNDVGAQNLLRAQQTFEFSNAELSKLLGVDVVIHPDMLGNDIAEMPAKAEDFFFKVVIGVAVVVVALGIVAMVMYWYVAVYHIDISPILNIR